MTTLWNPRKPLNQPPHFRTGEVKESISSFDPIEDTMKNAQFDRARKTTLFDKKHTRQDNLSSGRSI